MQLVQANVIAFQKQPGKPFIAKLNESISSCFASDVLAFSIFDPRKILRADSPNLSQYG